MAYQHLYQGAPDLVRARFAQARGLGQNVVRIWAHGNGVDIVLQTGPYSYDEKVFKSLDYVVHLAHIYNIRVRSSRLISKLLHNPFGASIDLVGLHRDHSRCRKRQQATAAHISTCAFYEERDCLVHGAVLDALTVLTCTRSDSMCCHVIGLVSPAV